MKKFKAVIVVSLIIVLGTLLLTGCKKVDPLDTDEIEKILADGAARAKPVATETLRRVKKAMLG